MSVPTAAAGGVSQPGTAEDPGAMLVRAAVAGDPFAFQALLHLHRPRLLGYIEHHLPAELRPTVDPTDVLQDVCAEAYRSIRGFEARGEDAMVRWLMTIAQHRMRHLLRAARTAKRGGRRQRAEGASDGDAGLGGVTELLERLAVYHRTPSQSAAVHELVAAVQRALDRLLPDVRQAVRLRHIDGLSARDAAVRMSRTEGAFHQLCHRGLQKLRAELRSESYFV